MTSMTLKPRSTNATTLTVDDFDQLLTHKSQHSKQDTCIWTHNNKVIKFTGDMKENIDSLMTYITCRCGFKQEFQLIMNAFGDKITRLREERNKHKDNASTFKKHLEALQLELIEKNKKIESLEESYYLIRRDSIPKEDVDKKIKENQTLATRFEQLQRKNRQLHHALKESEEECNQLNSRLLMLEKGSQEKELRWAKNESLLIQVENSSDSSRCSHYSEMRNRLESYDNLFRDLPMTFDEVSKVLKEYATDLPCFVSQEERELYFMAMRMNSNLWRKKVEIQIKDILEKRQSLKKQQEELNKKRSLGQRGYEISKTLN